MQPRVSLCVQLVLSFLLLLLLCLTAWLHALYPCSQSRFVINLCVYAAMHATPASHLWPVKACGQQGTFFVYCGVWLWCVLGVCPYECVCVRMGALHTRSVCTSVMVVRQLSLRQPGCVCVYVSVWCDSSMAEGWFALGFESSNSNTYIQSLHGSQCCCGLSCWCEKMDCVGVGCVLVVCVSSRVSYFCKG